MNAAFSARTPPSTVAGRTQNCGNSRSCSALRLESASRMSSLSSGLPLAHDNISLIYAPRSGPPQSVISRSTISGERVLILLNRSFLLNMLAPIP